MTKKLIYSKINQWFLCSMPYDKFSKCFSQPKLNFHSFPSLHPFYLCTYLFFLLNMYVRLVYQKFSAWMANHIMQSFITQNPNHEQIVRNFQTCHHRIRTVISHLLLCDGISSLKNWMISTFLCQRLFLRED